MVLCPMLRTKFPYLSLSDRISSMIKKKKERTIYQSRVSWRNHVTPNFLLVSCLPVNSTQASHYVQYLLCSRTYNHAFSRFVFVFVLFFLSLEPDATNERESSNKAIKSASWPQIPGGRRPLLPLTGLKR